MPSAQGLDKYTHRGVHGQGRQLGVFGKTARATNHCLTQHAHSKHSKSQHNHSNYETNATTTAFVSCCLLTCYLSRVGVNVCVALL